MVPFDTSRAYYNKITNHIPNISRKKAISNRPLPQIYIDRVCELKIHRHHRQVQRGSNRHLRKTLPRLTHREFSFSFLLFFSARVLLPYVSPIFVDIALGYGDFNNYDYYSDSIHSYSSSLG